MNKKTLRIAGWALGLSMAVAGIGVAVGASANKPVETKAATAVTSWVRVTSADTLLAGGTFVLGHEATANSGIVVPIRNYGSATTGVAGYLYSGVRPNGSDESNSNTINMATIGNNTADYEFTVAASTAVDGAITLATIYDSNPNDETPGVTAYVGNANTKNNLKLFTTVADTTSFTPTMQSNDKIRLDIQANTSGNAYRYFKYNNGNPRGAVYASGQNDVVAYKKVSTMQYTVTFNGNGGSTPDSKEVLSGQTFVFPSAGTRDGYEFLGWSSNGGTTKYDEGATSPAVTADITYTAYWEEITDPVVTLDKNALALTRFGDTDSGTVTASIVNIEDATYSWVRISGDDCITLANADTATVTITSKGSALSASATLKLTVNGTHGGNAITPIEKTVSVTVAKQSTSDHPYSVADAKSVIAGLPAQGTSESLYISGIVCNVVSASVSSGKLTYEISDDGTTTNPLRIYLGKGLNNDDFVAVSDVYVGDTVTVIGTLSKQYSNVNTGNYIVSQTKKTYTVSFDANGGSGTMDPSSEIRGSYELPTNEFTAPDNKEFAGWKIKVGEEIAPEIRAPEYEYTLNSNITLIAQWNDLVTLTYDANSGSGSMAPESYGSGATVTVKANGFTAPEGKMFAGWNTAPNGSGTPYAPAATFTISENTTLYAQWAVKAVLTYDANGGANAPAAEEYPTGTTATVASKGSITPPPLAGVTYGFVNWNTEADGTGTPYVPGATFTISGNVTLYAQWTKLPLSIGTTGFSDEAQEEAIDWAHISNGTKQSDVYYDGVHYHVSGTGNNGKIYNTGKEWRFYYDGGSSSALEISLLSSDTALRIKNITVTFTVDNNGQLKYDSSTLSSGTALNLSTSDLNSIALKVGHSSGSGGTIKITTIDTQIGYVSSFEEAQTFENTKVKKDVPYTDGTQGSNCLTWYSQAMDAYDSLSSQAKIWFSSRSEFANARARLIAWAAANGKTLTFDNKTGNITLYPSYAMVVDSMNPSESSAIWAAAIIGASVLGAGAFAFVLNRKKKDQ